MIEPNYYRKYSKYSNDTVSDAIRALTADTLLYEFAKDREFFPLREFGNHVKIGESCVDELVRGIKIVTGLSPIARLPGKAPKGTGGYYRLNKEYYEQCYREPPKVYKPSS